MKKKIIVILSIFTLLFLSSCGSKPEEENVEPEAPVEVETPEEEVPVEELPEPPVDETIGDKIDEISQEEIDALLAETNDARERAVKAGAESKYPTELKEADDYFNSLKNDKKALKEEHDKIIEMYNSVTNRIEKDNSKNALSSEIETARENAINAGVEEVLPEELKKLDEYVASLKEDEDKFLLEGNKVAGYYNELIEKKNGIVSEKIAKLTTEIETARKNAINAGVEEALPEELKKLDEYVASLKDDKEKFLLEGKNISGYYSQLIEMRNGIVSEKLTADADAARERAVKAGVGKVIPGELKKLDEYVANLKQNKEAWLSEGQSVPASYDALIATMNEINEKKANDRLLKNIDIARNKALKAGAEEKAPEELKKLDEYFAALKEDKEAWKAEGAKVSGYYNELTKIVNNRKIAENILVNIKTSRGKAIEAGAETKAADILKSIDDYTNVISGSSESVKDNGHKASNAYKSLVMYIDAIEAKKIVDEENLAPYAQIYYDRASAKMAAVESAYKNMDNVPQSIISDATSARRDFRNVITVAYKEMAKAERELAYEEKKNADKVRAAVTQKERYKSAVDNFKKGDSLYSMQDAKNAITYYRSAKEEFVALHSDVSEEMLAALAAIEAAKKNVAESSQYAEEADEIAPIKSDSIEGIEDEDTVLLEADDYEDPNASVIAIDDVVEVKEDAVVEEEIEELVADEKYVDVVVEEPEETVDAENVEETTKEAEPTPAETEGTEETTEDVEATPAETEQAEEAPVEAAPVPAETEQSEEVLVEAETAPAEQEKADEVPVEAESIPAENVTDDELVAVPEESEESSEDVDEAPVITDEVVTDTPVATEEKRELSKDDMENEVFAK